MIKLEKVLLKFILIFFLLFLSSCTSLKKQDGPPLYKKDVSKIPNAAPRIEQKSRYGNPDSYQVFGKRYYVLPTNSGYSKIGVASWYGTKFQNKMTSSREIYDLYKMTGAHRTLPLPTYVKVTNLENGKNVTVKINDRGPFVGNRLIDLSFAAAKKLGFVDEGTALVKVDAIEPFYSKDSIQKQKIYLQVGVYANLENAKHVLQHIENSSIIPCNIYYDSSKPKILYKVQVGPVTNVSDTLLLIKKAGFLHPIQIVKTV